MHKSYLLITCKPGQESEVKDKLEKIRQVREVDVLYGQYDIIAKVESEDEKFMKQLLLDELEAGKEVQTVATLEENH